MRGADIWDVRALRDPDKMIPAGPPFLGKESLQAISHAVREAGRLGLSLGMVAASGWNAGGPWITPENAGMGLFHSELTVEGPAALARELPFPEVPANCPRNPDGRPAYYRDVAVFAWPNTDGRKIISAASMVDLTGKLDSNGRIAWAVPAGPWTIFRSIMANTGHQLEVPSPNSGGPMIDFLNPDATVFHFRYIVDRLESKIGKLGDSALKYLEVDSMELGEETAWTGRILEEFVKRHRYDPFRYLPVLKGWTVESEDVSRRFLHDWRKTISDLFIESHYRTGSELLNEHGLQLCAEAGGCALGEGLNLFTFHTFTHSPAEAGLPGLAYHAGTHINPNVVWWPMARPFVDYLARSSYLLQQGLFVADVCYYYGDQAPNFVPSKHITYNPGAGFDYDVVNSDVILNRMTVENGRLVLPDGMSYALLVLPERGDMDLEVFGREEIAGVRVKPVSSGTAFDPAADAELGVLHPGAEVRSDRDNSLYLKVWTPGTYVLHDSQGRSRTVAVAAVPQPVEIAGPWQVGFPKGWGAPEHATFEKLASWTESDDAGIKYFPGRAVYRNTFDVPRDRLDADASVELDLGAVQQVARVTLNDRELDILWKPPYSIDITGAVRAGKNTLVVEVANT